jgi:hypothetical protein
MQEVPAQTRIARELILVSSKEEIAPRTVAIGKCTVRAMDSGAAAS